MVLVVLRELPLGTQQSLPFPCSLGFSHPSAGQGKSSYFVTPTCKVVKSLLKSFTYVSILPLEYGKDVPLTCLPEGTHVKRNETHVVTYVHVFFNSVYPTVFILLLTSRN